MRMKSTPKDFLIEELVGAWSDRTLRRNDEYQRGLVWKDVQKQRFIDSVFRGYPLPLLFFREKTKRSLGGKMESTYEVVDGLQRLEALSGFVAGKYPTLARENSKLALPESIAEHPCEWGGKFYADLGVDLQKKFLSREVRAVVIQVVETEDEVRDLFIRLQAGTALTRQQVRDAWPGPVGPFVGRIAGTAEIRPSVELFNLVDKRGRRKSEDAAEDEDPHHEARQTCAQLLTVYFTRLRNPREMPSLKPRALDDTYHANLKFDPAGADAQRFKKILALCEDVLTLSEWSKAPKIKKNDVFSLFNFWFDLTSNPSLRLSDEVIEAVRDAYWSPEISPPPTGRVTSSTTLWNHYKWFLAVKIGSVSIPSLDPQRLFNDAQKEKIWKKALDSKGVARCAICKLPIRRDEAEFDHVIPWVEGGKTIPENGQVVHREGACHRRGVRATEVAPSWNDDD